MYDLFFMEESGNIDNEEIEFDSGKENYLLTSVHHNDDNDKINFQKFYKIQTSNLQQNQLLKKKETETEEEEEKKLNEFIQIKKNTIISQFLKGFSHQESILKTFEGKIKGKFSNLPNLIFKKSNKDGKTIEEIDQIYILYLEKEKLTIDGFDYFYSIKYLNGKEKDRQIFLTGKKFELLNNNLYFLEIKHSLESLNTDYERLKQIKINKIQTGNSQDSFISARYKREELTNLGNTFLTFKIFRELLYDIMKNEEKECNLLYIVDSDFKENMVDIFENCLKRDKEIIEEFSLSFNLYLIYTQPDVALKHFIQENWNKNNEIKLLSQRVLNQKEQLGEKDKQITIQNEQILALNETLKIKEIEINIQNIQFSPIYVDKSIIEFINNKIQNKNLIVLIGLFEKINDNQTFICTAPNFFSKIIDKNEKLTLVDLKTFNKVKLKDLNNKDNELFFKIVTEDYKNNMDNFHLFNEIYILVDLIFLKNIRYLFDKTDLKKYNITAYILKKDSLILHLKKENFVIELIGIVNEDRENALFKSAESLNLWEMEQFAENYINLLKFKSFFENINVELLKGECYLFDFRGRINYILELYKKANNMSINNKRCFIQISAARDINNILIDKFAEQYIKNKECQNIIYIRKTEFGNSFTKEELLSILNYYFNIDINSECENRITWKKENKNLIINKTFSEEIIITRLIRNDSVLPIFQLGNGKINVNSIQIIEYLYFLFLPILIQEKYKPNVLIIADDYGILNNYYHVFYEKELNISFASRKNINEELFHKEVIIENYNKTEVNSYEEAFKIFRENKPLFDLIILEKAFNENQIDTSIPSIKNNFSNLLTPNGIFSSNIRSSSLYGQKENIDDLRKIYKTIKIIKLRKCSDFLICTNGSNIKINEKFIKIYPKLLELNYINTYLGQFITDIDEQFSNN